MYAEDVQIYNSGSLNGIRGCINNINSDLRKIDIWAMDFASIPQNQSVF